MSTTHPSQRGESFGDHLRRLRTARGLTLDDLAQTTGLHSSRIRQLELGLTKQPPSLDTIAALGGALGLDLPALLELGGKAVSTS